MLHQSRILFVKRNKPLDKWCIKREERKKRNEGMNYRQLKTKGVLATKTAVSGEKTGIGTKCLSYQL